MVCEKTGAPSLLTTASESHDHNQKNTPETCLGPYTFAQKNHMHPIALEGDPVLSTSHLPVLKPLYDNSLPFEPLHQAKEAYHEHRHSHHPNDQRTS